MLRTIRSTAPFRRCRPSRRPARPAAFPTTRPARRRTPPRRRSSRPSARRRGGGGRRRNRARLLRRPTTAPSAHCVQASNAEAAVQLVLAPIGPQGPHPALGHFEPPGLAEVHVPALVEHSVEVGG